MNLTFFSEILEEFIKYEGTKMCLQTNSISESTSVTSDKLQAYYAKGIYKI